jgi:three-Cys-motif partner protein
LDGFAGPGIYEGGESGSPVIALQTAVDHMLRPYFNEIRFFFIEKDRGRATMLAKILKERFPKLPENIKYRVEGAAFAPTFEQVLNQLEKSGADLAPTFAFLDPFGFSGLPMELIGRLLKCKKCEVLITFMAGFVRRFHDELREPALNELFATEEWKRVSEINDPDEKLRFLVGLYESQLKKLGGAQYVRSFGMIGESNQIIYYLVFATKHLKGLELMKEAMWKADRTGLYRFSDVTGFTQAFLMDFENEPAWVESAANAVYRKFKGRTVNEDEIYQFVVADTPFLYRKSVLRYLETSSPPKIINVSNRRRARSYPPGCSITFSR